MSILELVESIELPPLFAYRGVVCVNGRPVPREMWAFVRPRVRYDYEVVVTFHVPMHGSGGGQGGGGGKSTLAIVGMIALLVVASLITGGAASVAGFGTGTFFAAGSTEALILAAGVAVGGSLALSALSAPPKRALATDSGFSSDASQTDEGRQPSSIDGNVLARGDAIPRVLGTFKVHPPLGCEPLVELIGEDEFVEAFYILAGPHDLADIKIGDAPIDQMSDLEYETSDGLPGSSAITLINRQGKTDSPQIALSRHVINRAAASTLLDQIVPANSVPIWHPLATRDSPDEYWIQLAFQEGIVDFGTPSANMAVPVRFRFRAQGTETWFNVPEIHFSSSTGLSLQKMVRFHWEPNKWLQREPAPTAEGPVFAFKLVTGQTAVSPATAGWIADEYFSGGSGNDLYSNSAPTNFVKNIYLQQDGVDIYLDPATFPKNTYEIQVRAGSSYIVTSFTPSTYTFSGLAGSLVYDFFEYQLNGIVATLPQTRAQIHDKITVGRTTSIWHEPPIASGTFATIALRAKNRRINRLSTVASGYVRDWNGSDWGDYTTSSNPAPHMNDILGGLLNADALPPALIDSDALVAWRTACDDEGYTVDSIIQGGSVDDARMLVASCGYGRPMQSETWGILRDKDRSTETPVQIFSDENLSGLSWKKAFPRLPDGFRVIFNDVDLDYNENEIVVLRTGVKAANADRIEEMRYAGLVTTAAARARAEFDLDQLTLRSTFYSASAYADALVCRRGDLVGVQHAIIAHWAGSSRILDVVRDGSNQVVSLVLEKSVPAPGSKFITPKTFLSPTTFVVGNSFGASIRKTDGSIVVGQVVDDVSSDYVTTLVFTTPIPDPSSLIAADCIVTTGQLGQEYRRLVVFDMKPSKDLNVDITFVEEASELFTLSLDFTKTRNSDYLVVIGA